mgnify:CR=1 FL=1
MEGYLYLLRPDWSYLLNPETWVMAMGQAFFSLSINGAGMLIYGSYMKKGENILRHAGMTAVLDTLAALLAGFAILPAVFAFGIDPTSGPQLMFVTLPQIFQQMPGGRIFALCGTRSPCSAMCRRSGSSPTRPPPSSTKCR